jgi:hypothetical protein
MRPFLTTATCSPIFGAGGDQIVCQHLDLGLSTLVIHAARRS